jgi:phospholipid/cholesterol/gamma-HCH transport system substrate-binding protein
MTKQARIGILAVAVVAAAIYLTALRGDDGGYTIKAELVSAGGLRKNSSVKIHGVPAGKIKALEVTGRDTAIATLEIDDGAAPIGRGAQLNVRPTDLLGERYAEIKGGDPSRPLPSGAEIPKADTAEPVELDDVLNMLDAGTRQRLGILVNEVGVALTGRGSDLNKLLAQLPPSLQDTSRLLKQVANENAAMKAGITRASHVAGLVDGRRDELGGLLSQASDALQVVAQKREDLAGTIQNAPAALTRLRSTLANLDTASTELRPAAADLRATAAPLKTTLETLPDFTKEAGPALAKARAVSPALTRLARGATPTVKLLQPTVENASRSLVQSVPILHQLDRRGWDDLLYFVNNMNLGLRDRDGIGHFIGAKLNIATEYIDNAIENFTNVDLSKPVPTDADDLAPKTPAKQAGDTPAPAPAPAPPAAGTPENPVKKLTDKLKDTTDKLIPGGVGAAVGDAVQKALGGISGAIPGLLNGAQPKKQGVAPPEGSDALRLFDYLMGQ